mgnify:CR=1 FL=1
MKNIFGGRICIKVQKVHKIDVIISQSRMVELVKKVNASIKGVWLSVNRRSFSLHTVILRHFFCYKPPYSQTDYNSILSLLKTYH